MYPLLFVLRRIVYSLVIVFMIDGNKPFFGTLILTLTCLAMQMFVAVEAQWESRMLNAQELVNESIFYTLCLGLICCSGVLNSTEQSIMLGWLMIGLVFSLLAFNSALIFCELMNFIRLLCLRSKNRAAAKK